MFPTFLVALGPGLPRMFGSDGDVGRHIRVGANILSERANQLLGLSEDWPLMLDDGLTAVYRRAAVGLTGSERRVP